MKKAEPFVRSDLDPVMLANVGLGGEPTDDAKAGKSGDPIAAMRNAVATIGDEFLNELKEKIGDRKPLIVGVVSIESSGYNQLPLAAAAYISRRLGLDLDIDIVQTNSPKRTTMEGLDRVFNAPTFGGKVQSGRDYVILDDTLTQGATFASLASHIREHGGNVLASVAMNGKKYSTPLRLEEKTLNQIRAKYGDVEDQFQTATGYDFANLTQSEARYVCNHNKPDAVRDRIATAANEAKSRTYGALDGRATNPDNQKILSTEKAQALVGWMTTTLLCKPKENLPKSGLNPNM